MAIGEPEERPCVGGPLSSMSSSSHSSSLAQYGYPHSPSVQQSSQFLPAIPELSENSRTSSSIAAANGMPPDNTASSRDNDNYQNDDVETSNYTYRCNELSKTKPALDVMEMGYPQEVVQTVIQIRFAETGVTYTDTVDLLDAVEAYMAVNNTDQERTSNSNSPLSSRENIPEDNSVIQQKDNTRQKPQKVKSKVRSQRLEKSSTKKPHKSQGDISADGDQVDGNSFATSSYSKLPSTFTLKEENTKMKSSRMCKICMENESRVVFLPCGHLVSCAECGQFVMKCNVCNQRVKGSVKVFLA